jgi:hypothetical protein
MFHAWLRRDGLVEGRFNLSVSDVRMLHVFPWIVFFSEYLFTIQVHNYCTYCTFTFMSTVL